LSWVRQFAGFWSESGVDGVDLPEVASFAQALGGNPLGELAPGGGEARVVPVEDGTGDADGRPDCRVDFTGGFDWLVDRDADFEVEVGVGPLEVVGEPGAGRLDALNGEDAVDLKDTGAYDAADLFARDGQLKGCVVLGLCEEDLRRLDHGCLSCQAAAAQNSILREGGRLMNGARFRADGFAGWDVGEASERDCNGFAG
jgi:hypothetical protein